MARRESSVCVSRRRLFKTRGQQERDIRDSTGKFHDVVFHPLHSQIRSRVDVSRQCVRTCVCVYDVCTKRETKLSPRGKSTRAAARRCATGSPRAKQLFALAINARSPTLGAVLRRSALWI